MKSPITSLFYSTSGGLHKNIADVFNSSFIVSSHPGYSTREARYKLQEFSSIKGTKTYKCSNTCDYVYFIEDCGQAMAEYKCPLDGATLGGGDHKLTDRVGHVELTDDQAKTHLQTCIAKYEAQASPGYSFFKASDINEDKYLTALKPFTFNFLSALVNANILLLLQRTTKKKF